MTNSKGIWIGIAAVAALAAFLVARQIYPQLIEQTAAGIVAFFAFILSLFFRRKKTD